MKRLCDLVDILINNEFCVLYKVKDNVKLDLIALGCFNGNEDMIRITKGRTPEITIFKNDNNLYSYHFGEVSTTSISENLKIQRSIIREATILDFGIITDLSYFSKSKEQEFELIKSTLHVKSLDDATRDITLVSGGGSWCNIKVNSQTMELDVHVNDVHKWFENRGYKVEFDIDITKGLPCGKVFGHCDVISKTLDENNLNNKISIAKKSLNKNLKVDNSRNDELEK